MKPTRIILIIAAALFAATVASSCGNKAKATEEPFTEEYDTWGDEYSDSGEDLFCNYMSREQWPQDAFFDDMVEVYNSFVLLNGIKSVGDVWKRYDESEIAFESLKCADINILKKEDIKERFAQCLALGRKFFSEHVDYSDSLLYRQFADSLNCLDSVLSTRFHISNYSNVSTEAYWNALDFSKQSKDLFDKVSTKEITADNIDTKEVQKDIAFILESIKNEKDFDKKCAYTMKYVYYVGFYRTDFELIEELLDDGRYSPYLFFLWRIWRCGVQLHDMNYGPSTWSPIPNKLYNEKRLKIAETTLKYIVTHRNDGIAINQYLITASISNIMRIGDYPFGNESFTELYYLDLGA